MKVPVCINVVMSTVNLRNKCIYHFRRKLRNLLPNRLFRRQNSFKARCHCVFLFIGAVAPKQIESSTVRVQPNELQLSIDHFSWRIVAFIRSLFTSHISIGCYPLLPRCMPKSRKVVFHVHVYKAQRGMREVMNATFVLSVCDDTSVMGMQSLI